MLFLAAVLHQDHSIAFYRRTLFQREIVSLLRFLVVYGALYATLTITLTIDVFPSKMVRKNDLIPQINIVDDFLFS